MFSENDQGFCPKVDNRYVNPHIYEIRRRLFDVVLWKSGYYQDAKFWPKAPENFSYPIPEFVLDEDHPRAVWINHCTFLITVDNVNILTDPIWSERCSPLPFFGPRRRHDPAIRLEDLPKVHYVLISHNHYDHLDKKTVQWLCRNHPDIVWLVPEGVKKWFLKQGIEQVVELAWWQSVELCDEHAAPHVQLKATAVPSQHFSGRSFRDMNETLWAGWVVEFMRKEKPFKRLYFVGDTGYNPVDFKNIGKKWGHMDLSLIPIGTYLPREFMSPVHIEPVNSVNIHKEVGSRLSLGMHWKTFHLSDEPLHQPPYDLLGALQKEGIDPNAFLAVEPGFYVNW